MGGGGKGGSSSTTVSIPPEVLARYNAVNAQAQQLGGIDPTTGQPNTPYTPYSGEFVAPLNATQNAAVGNINASQGIAQPYYNTAAQYTQEAARSFQPLSQQDIQRYQNPFVQSVVDPTVKALQQQQGQQLAQQQSNAIKSGAFGGDRSGIERAVLQGQQDLATAQAISPLYSQAYQSGLGAAQQQQQVGGQGLMGAGAQLANLGSGAQSSALAGANAQLAAGTVGQQTQQALDTAKYQQFLQQQGYPFQLTQFLANIAEGTGALSGSTTSTTQASDERLKHDIKKIGTANDGLPIYSFKYKGDDQIRIGFMAQDVEKKMPDAVGVMGGYKTVDYGKVSDANAKEHRAMGGGVWEPGAYSFGGREHHSAGNAVGGSQMLVDPTDWAALVQAHGQITNPYGAGAGNKSGTPGASGVVPSASLAVPKLVQASSPQLKQSSGIQDALSTGKTVSGLASDATKLKDWYDQKFPDKKTDTKPDATSKADTTSKADLPSAKANPVSLESQDGQSGFKIPEGNSTPSTDNVGMDVTPPDATPDLEGFFAYGGVVPRGHFGMGGNTDPYGLNQGTGEELPKDVVSASESSKDEAEKEAPKPGKTGGGGGGDSTLSDIGTAASIVGTAAKIIPFFLASGGVVPREHHAGNEGNVVGDDGGGGGSDGPQYKIQPQNLEDMPEHRQSLIKAIYAPESGGRYDVLNGGETFDNTQQHPNRVGKNGESTAAGAGQFIKSTWDDVTGNAPMTKPYMDSATWTLAARDYNKRTGKDLDQELQKNGVTPEIKSALSDTWTGLKGPGPNWRLPTMARGDETNRRNSSLGDVFSEMTSDAVPSGKSFWVPLLSAIATAGASRAPTRGQALAEGLAGGISGYMSTKDLEMKQAKQMIDFTKDNFVHTVNGAGQDVLYNKMTGQQYSPSDFNAYMYDSFVKQGIDPSIYGLKKPAGTTTSPVSNIIADKAAKVGAATSQPTSPDHAVPAPDVDKPSQNMNTMNTGQLYQAALEGKIPGVPQDAAQQQAQIKADLQRANTLAANPDPTVASNGIKLRELAMGQQKLLDDKINQAISYQADQNKEFAKGRSERINNYSTEVQNRAPSYNTAFSNLERLAQLGAEFNTGRGAQTKADVVNAMQSAGLGRFIPSDWQKMPGDADQILKQSTALLFNQLQADKIVRAEKTGLNYEKDAIPSPATSAPAFYALVGQKLAEAHQSYDKDSAWASKPVGSMEPVQHELTWSHQKGNDLDSYKRRAYDSIPANPNITDEQFASLQNSVKDPQTGETFNPKRYKAPAAQGTTQPAAPQLPEPLRGVEGLQFSPSRQQYKDANGNVYDKSGNRVQ